MRAKNSAAVISEPDKQASRAAFWKISGAGATFQAGSSAVDSATIIAGFVYQLTGNVFAVGLASAVLRLGWLLPQIIVGFLAQRARRRMPFYAVGAFGRAFCLALIAALLAGAAAIPTGWLAVLFLLLWTAYAFVSGIVAVPYNDIVGRSIPSDRRSRMLALRFFGGGVLALLIAFVVHRLLAAADFQAGHAAVFLLAAVLMALSAVIFVSAGEPETAAPAKEASAGFGAFVREGWLVLRDDRRFRLFLYTQWLGGAALMALPFYVVVAARLDLATADVAILLAAQTAGSLASNAAWGGIGDRFGKLSLLRAVALLRLAPPLLACVILSLADADSVWRLAAFAMLFVLLGALLNGTTIGFLGYLMEISPDQRRPAYSAYFNALASPAALLPLLGAVIVALFGLYTLFILAALAACAQVMLIRRLAGGDDGQQA